ncbi:MAG TPA: trypsin-like peptidase domain-containing protein [Candidatus Paceibacterota bacterium]
MDIEQLNRKQIVLLTLLVSFVTSIATGIVTVSLMQQAPPQMEAAVNHIIERTVQQVGPAIPVTSTVKTVVVKNDDLVASSIATVQKSIVRIVDRDNPDMLVARGIIVDPKGIVLTDRGSLDASIHYVAILNDGTRLPISLAATISTSTPVAAVQLELGTSTPALTAVALADQSKLALGQTVIRIGGGGGDAVGEGVIAQLPDKADSYGTAIEATVSSETPGSVLISLFGEVIGIVTTNSIGKGSDFYSLIDMHKAIAGADQQASAAAAVKSASTATGQ